MVLEKESPKIKDPCRHEERDGCGGGGLGHHQVREECHTSGAPHLVGGEAEEKPALG